MNTAPPRAPSNSSLVAFSVSPRCSPISRDLLVSSTVWRRSTPSPHNCFVSARATVVFPHPGGPTSRVCREVTGTANPIFSRAALTLVVARIIFTWALAATMPSMAASSASPSARYWLAATALRAASACLALGAEAGSHGSVRASIVSGLVRINRRPGSSSASRAGVNCGSREYTRRSS